MMNVDILAIPTRKLKFPEDLEEIPKTFVIEGEIMMKNNLKLSLSSKYFF